MSRATIRTLFAVTAFALSTAVCADTYPSKPITLVVPFNAGTTSDASARVLARGMSRVLNQPIVVENRIGAAGTIGASFVAKSTADGYTLLYTTSSVHAIGPAALPNLTWDPLKSFVPIALVAKLPQVLVATTGLKATSLDQVIAGAAAYPQGLNYASLGNSTTQNLTMVQMASKVNLRTTHIPYSSNAAIYPDMVTGRVQLMFDNIPTALPFIQSGKVNAIGVTSTRRVSILPEVKTLAEQGMQGFEAVAWTGLMAPAGTPKAVIEAIASAATSAMKGPEFQSWLAANGAFEDPTVTPSNFRAFADAEVAKWRSAAEAAGIVGKN